MDHQRQLISTYVTLMHDQYLPKIDPFQIEIIASNKDICTII